MKGSKKLDFDFAILLGLDVFTIELNIFAIGITFEIDSLIMCFFWQFLSIKLIFLANYHSFP